MRFRVSAVLFFTAFLSSMAYAEPVMPPPSNYETDIMAIGEYKKFLSVKLGDDWEKVKALFGGEVEENKIGKPFREKGKKYNTKGWTTIHFQVEDGKVYYKSSGGVAMKFKAEVTKEHFDLLKKGMTYDELKAILGEGILVSEWVWPDGSRVVQQYEWRAKNRRSYINIGMTNGKADAIQKSGM